MALTFTDAELQQVHLMLQRAEPSDAALRHVHNNLPRVQEEGVGPVFSFGVLGAIGCGVFGAHRYYLIADP